MTRSEHRRHDRLLVTRFAMDDAYPAERDEARALIESCTECAALVADIRLVASSLSSLPRPARPRDFTLTPEQAETLRGSRWSRWLRALAMPGWGTLRPVAGVALSMGLVMAVVGAAMPRVDSAPAFESAAAPSAAASKDGDVPDTTMPMVGAPEPAPPGGQNEGREFHVQETKDPVTDGYDTAYVDESFAPSAEDDGQASALASPAEPTRDLLIYTGLAIATLSFGLLALAWFARRYLSDPLLR